MWDSDRPVTEHIRDVMTSIGITLRLTDVSDGDLFVVAVVVVIYVFYVRLKTCACKRALGEYFPDFWIFKHQDVICHGHHR